MNNQEKTFLTYKLNQIRTRYGSGGNRVFEDYYDKVGNTELKEIFSIVHYRLNGLLEFMNDKNNFNYGGHYNADPSRDLIEIIEIIKVLQSGLKDTPYYFIIDSYYENILKICKGFLSKRGGSTIPQDFPKIDIIEHKPIFSLNEIITIQSLNRISKVQMKFIGEGSYANVYKYKDPYYNTFFAIKRAKKGLTDIELKRLKNEYNELRNLDSPLIIKAYNYNEEKNEYTMEYADETLEKYISKNNSKLTMQQRKTLIIQLLRVFTYIHGKNILHRDISYQNILVKKYEDNSIFIKVSDFGLVKKPESTLTREGTEIKGLLNDPSLAVVGFENYEVRHEIYALTQVVHFILSGKKNGIKVDSDSVKELLLRGLSADISNRFSSVKELWDAFNKVSASLK